MTSEAIEPLIDLGDLPFYVGEQDVPTNVDLPDVLPFKIGFHPQLKLLVQIPDKGVEQFLEQAYHKGSIVGSPMEEQGIGRRYADDFLNFVTRILACENVRLKGARALEVGCGSGYLLYRLQETGADVVGVEPGEHGQQGGRKYDVRIVRGMFGHESVSTLGRFDLILHFTVMEHVMDPAGFLAAQAKCLKPGGLVMFAVPDCGEYIQSADVSMLMHEHWNYFSPASLKATVEVAGLNLLHLERAGFGGCIYAVAGLHGQSISVDSQTEAIESFASRLKGTLVRVGEFFAAAARGKHSVGVYCPGRFYNLLHLIKPSQCPRFFDDAERLQGRYYPPIDVPVESRNALVAHPVDDLLIMSRSFGEKLMSELAQEESLRRARFILPDELLGRQ